MGVTNQQSGTNVHEIADRIYRINTPVIIEGGPGGFSFNQYLIVDDQPLLFHTGPRKMFPLVREAVASVIPVERLRYVAFSHVEADECGSLNQWLAAAPQSLPLCGSIAALVSIEDLADRSPRALAVRELLSLGEHSVRWFDTPHLPIRSFPMRCAALFKLRPPSVENPDEARGTSQFSLGSRDPGPGFGRRGLAVAAGLSRRPARGAANAPLGAGGPPPAARRCRGAGRRR